MEIWKPTLDIVFRCLAGDCPDTCCGMWEVVVDEEAYERWKKLPAPWAKTMEEATEIVDHERIMKMVDTRCCMLDDKGLCRFYAEFGMEELCRNCRLHPRFVETYGAYRQMMPGLSCPAWAKLWLMKDEVATFEKEVIDELPFQNDYDPQWFLTLKRSQKTVLAMLQDRSIPLNIRIAQVLSYASELDGISENEQWASGSLTTYVKKLSTFEILMPQWRELLGLPHPQKVQPWQEVLGEQYMVYAVFRYWMHGVETGKVLPWVKLAALSWACIKALSSDCASREECCEVARLFSKEIDHNLESIEALYRVCCRHGGHYSSASILQALEESL